MNRNDFEIEICANSLKSVLAAEKGGADRVELCDNLVEGGTTPSAGTIYQAKNNSSIDIYVIIRPRAGDFLYSTNEQEIMIKDIQTAIEVGANGVVIGCLNRDGTVNYELCSRLIEKAKGLPVTFHRAFDMTRDPFEALETVKKLGVSRILTSGQQQSAYDGTDLLAELNERCGKNIKIMPGGGINEGNIIEIAEKTKTKAFHASLRELVESKMDFRREDLSFTSVENEGEYWHNITSVRRIKKVIELLEGMI